MEFVDEIGVDEAEHRDGERVRGFDGGVEAVRGDC